MIDAKNTVLLVIDIQGRLASLMFERDQVVRNIQAMIKGAKILEIPIIWTEQMPQKIGQTIPEVANLLSDIQPIEKESFSCWPNKRFQETLAATGRKHILIIGIETHVCIYQTVADLLTHKYDVHVIADAVSSRTQNNKAAGLEKIKRLNAQITCVEMILCEMLQTAEHPKFKDILNLMK